MSPSRARILPPSGTFYPRPFRYRSAYRSGVKALIRLRKLPFPIKWNVGTAGNSPMRLRVCAYVRIDRSTVPLLYLQRDRLIKTKFCLRNAGRNGSGTVGFRPFHFGRLAGLMVVSAGEHEKKAGRA